MSVIFLLSLTYSSMHNSHTHTHTSSLRDEEGLRLFYYLVQDLKCMVFSLISLHFKIKPI